MSNIGTTDPFSAKEIIGDNVQQLLTHQVICVNRSFGVLTQKTSEK